MKPLLLLLFIAETSVCVFAQTPMDFESWTTMNNGVIPVPEEPTGWITGNQLVSFASPGNSASVFKVTGTEAHGGQYAMKIVTTNVVNDPSGGQLPDPTGVAFAGKVQIAPLKLINGFQYTGRPAACDFWYKYAPQSGDSASCGIMLTKWNGSSTDTIATGEIIIKNAVATYTQASFNLVYDPLFSSVSPDTMIAGFSATCSATNTCGIIGSTLWVDDLVFSGYNGINEHSFSNGVILYPNPACDFVTIYIDESEAVSAIVHDAAGRVVASSASFEHRSLFNREYGVINTSNLSSGIYSYSVVDKNGNVLRSGKFNVVK